MLWLLKRLSAWVSRMPLERALRVGRFCGWIYGSVLRYHRRDALQALARSFPDLSPAERRRLLDRVYANQGMTAVETLRFCRSDDGIGERIKVINPEIAEQVLAGGRGALALTAHTGNWEAMGGYFAWKGIPLTIIAKLIKNPRINQYVVDTRRRFGLEIVPPRGAYRACLRKLKQGGAVGFMIDQNMIRTEGVFVDFFGHPACTTSGLAHLAASSGAPIIPIFSRRLGRGRHEIVLLPPLDPPRDREPETLREATQAYTRIVEDFIRQHPDQWIWMHRRWRTKVTAAPTPAPDPAG